ncbi:hypothetical protein E3A20_04270 [Planctomyces bekefii]|uniref:Cytochrome c domain-containing protein n=1 Tax=Planctomyces bekefii TaxID=1653850 RepID=A0A5C6MC76_9PLAN|nr:hypothetical protein E3A20_04270 [Planctomyces bekefii]
MPLRGPYFGQGDVAIVNQWIDEDLYVATDGAQWDVEVITGSGVSSDKLGMLEVPDDDRLVMILTLDQPGSNIEVGGTCPIGALTELSDRSSSYESGVIKADCSIAITRTFSSSGDGGGDGDSPELEQFVVSMSAAYGRENGATPNIVTSARTKIGMAGEAVAFDFTVRSNDRLSSVLSESIAGSCPSGVLELVSESAGAYRYTTGAISGDCEVVIKTQNPCPTVLPSVTFTDVNAILTAGLVQSCTNCHYSGSSDVGDAFSDFGSGQGGFLVHSKLTGSSASNGLKIVDSGRPLSSALYLQIDPVLNYRSRMPYEGPYIGLEDRSRVCNWIFEGAQDN